MLENNLSLHSKFKGGIERYFVLELLHFFLVLQNKQILISTRFF